MATARPSPSRPTPARYSALPRTAHQPDLAVIDVRMPPTHTDEGIRAALVIRRQYPGVAVLVLSQHVEESYATDLLSVQTSSVGYLLKDRVAHVADFLDAVRRVAAGGTVLDPEVVAQLLVRRRDELDLPPTDTDHRRGTGCPDLPGHVKRRGRGGVRPGLLTRLPARRPAPLTRDRR